MVYILGISGGTGAGKSTLAYGLKDRHPEKIDVLHFDDYQKEKEQVPRLHGFRNWDHPDAIDFDSLLDDLTNLKDGNSIDVMTLSDRHTDYKLEGRVLHTIQPKPIIIVEGYLAFHDERARSLYDFMVFLDLHHDVRMELRTKFKKPGYAEKILLPMHEQYVEPTKRYAHLMIDRANRTPEEIQDIVEAELDV